MIHFICKFTYDIMNCRLARQCSARNFYRTAPLKIIYSRDVMFVVQCGVYTHTHTRLITLQPVTVDVTSGAIADKEVGDRKHLRQTTQILNMIKQNRRRRQSDP